MRKWLSALAVCLAAGALTPAAAEQMPAGDGPGPNLVLQVGGSVKGKIVIDLLPQAAPNHVERIVKLTQDHDYDNVIFHRVIDGFMAQTGDVQFGKRGGDVTAAGMGGSKYPDLKAEFSDLPFERGTVGMARSASPDSANSQFFIMFAPAPHLDGQYTVIGHVISGMDVVDKIKKGDGSLNGLVKDPDYIVKATIE
ncbi:peptidylprolyl isomerase [Paenirhodobacter enshiensis]|uniref:peptidylprolyl isomerase n=1 Tax=Paenirhodobacter enshiensis TaxID=1105367 RepID=UPI003FA23460